MKNRLKPLLAALLCLLLLLSLGGCGKKQETPAPALRQKAEAVLGPQETADDEALQALFGTVASKRDDAKGALAALEGQDAAIVAAVAEEADYSLELLQAEAELQSDDDAALTERLLGLWSRYDDLAARAAGYAGLCAAMCTGTDAFSFEEDATGGAALTAFPSGYFFDPYIASFDGPCCFALCDSYLEGYGMEQPLLALIGAEGGTPQQARDYAAGRRQAGLYTMEEADSDEGYLWYGCWENEDGSCCYLAVVYGADAAQEYAAELGAQPDFFLLIGNFDFLFCIRSAFTYALNASFS